MNIGTGHPPYPYTYQHSATGGHTELASTLTEAQSDQVVTPTEQTHDFWPEAGGACQREVERPNGLFAECGEPIKSPVHDPAAYLAYAAELRAELAKWGRGEGEYAPEPVKLTEPQARMLAAHVHAAHNGCWPALAGKQSSELRTRLYGMGLLGDRASWPYYEVTDRGVAALRRYEERRTR